ncbi:MAG TPA: DNA repair protein RadC [Flavipsychrobacter sp.]|nr:DNA repair protein RadC [Flavipsychrobacter sp.]
MEDKNYIRLKDRKEDEQPREKLMHKGATALSDAELLAILISSGTKERSAIDLARDVLSHAQNNLHELGRLSLKELQQTKGIGEARAITIAAALELGRRRQTNGGLKRESINSSKAAADIIIPLLRDLNHEAFCVLYLNQSNKLIKYELISNGGITGTVADLRIILKNALLNNSSQIIVAHNHPSGNLTPSEADKKLTKKLRDAAALMDIKLLDHVIIGDINYLSFQDEGLM